MEEIFDVYTRDGEYLGTAPKSVCHSKNPGFYHKPVWMWIINSKNEILVQKRASCKKTCPDLWENCGGHVDAGESMIHGAIREVYEELGVKTKESDYITLCEFTLDITFEIATIYLLKLDLDINEFKLRKEEVSDIKWLSFDEFKKLFYSSDFVDYGDEYRNLMIKLLQEHFITEGSYEQ